MPSKQVFHNSSRLLLAIGILSLAVKSSNAADGPLRVSVSEAEQASLRQINSGDWSTKLTFENTGEEDLILWPFVSLEVLDSDGKPVSRSLSIGRFGRRKSASVIEEIEFVTLAAGESHDVPVNLKRYSFDPNAIIGWQLSEPGKYKLVLRYKFQRDEAKKSLGKGCRDLDGRQQPWNRALEIDIEHDVEIDATR